MLDCIFMSLSHWFYWSIALMGLVAAFLLAYDGVRVDDSLDCERLRVELDNEVNRINSPSGGGELFERCTEEWPEGKPSWVGGSLVRKETVCTEGRTCLHYLTFQGKRMEYIMQIRANRIPQY